MAQSPLCNSPNREGRARQNRPIPVAAGWHRARSGSAREARMSKRIDPLSFGIMLVVLLLLAMARLGVSVARTIDRELAPLPVAAAERS
jgi:hypothetical protein